MKATVLFHFFLWLILLSYHSKAQEFAADFTQTDCKGVEHHFYSELDEGKVIILDFVMLGCSPCFWATRELDTIIASYADSHPGRLAIYSFSYDSSFTCEQMYAWRAEGGFTDVVLFTRGNELVSYYGGIGMPTIVVTGSSLHKVFYNGFGYDPSDNPLIISAIDNALIYEQSGTNDLLTGSNIKIYPTLFTDRIIIDTEGSLPGSQVIIYDGSGRKIISSLIPTDGLLSIPAASLSKGIYFALIKSGNRLTGSAKLIKP